MAPRGFEGDANPYTKAEMKSEPRTELDPLALPLYGTHLVEAGAGTGKTYQLTSLYLRLVVERDIPVDRILAVTFTRAATQELSGRIRARLAALAGAFRGEPAPGDPVVSALAESHPTEGPGRVERALRHFDEAAVSTIHGFCQRVLTAAAFESGAPLSVNLTGDSDEYLALLAEDFYRLHFYDAPEEFLRYARKEKAGPGDFHKLLDTRERHGEMRVEGRSGRPEISALAPVRLLSAQVRQEWPNVRDDVEALFRDGRLNASSYTGKIVGKMLARMDDYAASVTPAFPLFEDFERFTASKLAVSIKKAAEPFEHPFFLLCQDLFTQAKMLETQFGELLEHLHALVFSFADRELPGRKARQNVRFYGDLISSLRKALSGPRGAAVALAVGARFDCALVDEFQDTDPAQYAIFKALFGGPGKALFMIGDPKQAIYAFRGADIFSYLKAAADAGERHTLATNRRSEPGLIRAVNAVFGKSRAPFVLPGIDFTPARPAKIERPPLVLPESRPRLSVWLLDPRGKDKVSGEDARARVTAALVAEISLLVAWGREGRARLGDEALSERHMAVLVKNHDEARDVEQALRSAGVRALRYGTDNLYRSPEAAEMLTLLTALARPGDGEALRAALATRMMGRTAAGIHALLSDPEASSATAESFRGYSALWRRRGFAAVFRFLAEREDIVPRLLAHAGGERRITNLQHIAELLSKMEAEHRLGPAGLAERLARAAAGRIPGGEEAELRLESDADAVRIVTVHASKGLEYPVVFCPFFFAGIKKDEWPAVHHDPARGDEPVLPLTRAALAAGAAAMKRERLAESVRLLYVGLTRARNHCYTAWGPVNLAGDSAPAYLFHGPEEDGSPEIETWLAGADNRLKNKGLDDIRQALAPVVEASGGSLALVSPPETATPLPPPPPEAREALREPSFSGRIDRSRRVTSYSALASHASAGLDEAARQDEARPPRPAQNSEPEPAPDIAAFPRGPEAGLFFHDLLEHWDFSLADPILLRSHVDERLAAHGFSQSFAPAAAGMVESLAAMPLSPLDPGLSLSKISRANRADELEFTIPLAPVTPETLSRAFSGAKILERVPGGVADLDFLPVRGFVRGFMDMVFAHEGRYFLVDWKSNHLGPRPEDYGEEALRGAMALHRYVLQYHLYLLALKRHLARKVPGFNYETHFGGVFYIFLRGAVPGRGVFFDLPEPALMDRLEENLVGKGSG